MSGETRSRSALGCAHRSISIKRGFQAIIRRKARALEIELLESRALMAADTAAPAELATAAGEMLLSPVRAPTSSPATLDSALPSRVIRITGPQHNQLRISDPGDDTLIDLRGAKFYGLEDALWLEGQPAPVQWPSQTDFASIPETSNPERYPVSIVGTSKRVTVLGGKVVGMLNHLAPWHVWKMHADGDGVRMEGAESYEVNGTMVDNVEDGFGPLGSPGATFSIHDVFGRRIHDDAVENDGIHSGEIRNSYFETQTFYSARGGSNPAAEVTIDNCVVAMTLQPHQGGTLGPEDINTAGGYPYPDGLGSGTIFKMDWGTNRSGIVHVKNSVFLLERPATSSFAAMKFAPGTYENVTVVWLGPGDYPWPAPPGVTITRDRTVFDRARAAFFATHPQFAADGAEPPGIVLDRHVFYNASKFDGGAATAGPADDAAIAPDKRALLPGQTATPANYTSYSRGINGLMVDFAHLPGIPTAVDFAFKVGNRNDPGHWTPLAAPPTISLRRGAGTAGSDRVTLTWPDHLIQKEWLQVTVKPTAATGLAAPDIFYFGNAIGEVNDSQFNALVSAADEIATRNHARTILTPAQLNNVYDFNRDGLVNAGDQIGVRNNATTFLSSLRLISVPRLMAGASVLAPMDFASPASENDVTLRLRAVAEVFGGDFLATP